MCNPAATVCEIGKQIKASFIDNKDWVRVTQAPLQSTLSMTGVYIAQCQLLNNLIDLKFKARRDTC